MRLIDANAARKVLVGYERYTGIDELPVEFAVNEIDKIPTVDAAPVRYAVWVPIDDDPHEDFECGRCGFTIFATDWSSEGKASYRYCPYCGAKMEEW